MDENVKRFFELCDSDPALRERIKSAEESYPGSWEMREGLVSYALLPAAEELGLPFTVEELRHYEAEKWAKRHQDEETGDEDVPEGEVYWLLNRGWSSDEAHFCGDK